MSTLADLKRCPYCHSADIIDNGHPTFPWRCVPCDKVFVTPYVISAAPATPAATPLREANQQRVNAAVQRVRQDLEEYPADDEFRKDVELLIEIALAPVLEIFAAAQPQRESEQLEQAAKLTEKILTELFKKFSGKEFKSIRHALRRTLEPIMRAALSPQTDSQEPR